jgi:hypothetical protein
MKLQNRKTNKNKKNRTNKKTFITRKYKGGASRAGGAGRHSTIKSGILDVERHDIPLMDVEPETIVASASSARVPEATIVQFIRENSRVKPNYLAIIYAHSAVQNKANGIECQRQLITEFVKDRPSIPERYKKNVVDLCVALFELEIAIEEGIETPHSFISKGSMKDLRNLSPHQDSLYNVQCDDADGILNEVIREVLDLTPYTSPGSVINVDGAHPITRDSKLVFLIDSREVMTPGIHNGNTTLSSVSEIGHRINAGNDSINRVCLNILYEMCENEFLKHIMGQLIVQLDSFRVIKIERVMNSFNESTLASWRFNPHAMSLIFLATFVVRLEESLQGEFEELTDEIILHIRAKIAGSHFLGNCMLGSFIAGNNAVIEIKQSLSVPSISGYAPVPAKASSEMAMAVSQFPSRTWNVTQAAAVSAPGPEGVRFNDSIRLQSLFRDVACLSNSESDLAMCEAKDRGNISFQLSWVKLIGIPVLNKYMSEPLRVIVELADILPEITLLDVFTPSFELKSGIDERAWKEVGYKYSLLLTDKLLEMLSVDTEPKLERTFSFDSSRTYGNQAEAALRELSHPDATMGSSSSDVAELFDPEVRSMMQNFTTQLTPELQNKFFGIAQQLSTAGFHQGSHLGAIRTIQQIQQSEPLLAANVQRSITGKKTEKSTHESIMGTRGAAAKTLRANPSYTRRFNEYPQGLVRFKGRAKGKGKGP